MTRKPRRWPLIPRSGVQSLRNSTWGGFFDGFLKWILQTHRFLVDDSGWFWHLSCWLMTCAHEQWPNKILYLPLFWFILGIASGLSCKVELHSPGQNPRVPPWDKLKNGCTGQSDEANEARNQQCTALQQLHPWCAQSVRLFHLPPIEALRGLMI
jgi:hypothetical protein